MTENQQTKDLLDTLQAHLTQAHDRDQSKDAAFATFTGNVLGKLDDLQAKIDAQSSAPQNADTPPLTADDVAEIRQMVDTADKIGLVGLADFGVTSDGGRVGDAPPSAPTDTPPPHPADTLPETPPPAVLQVAGTLTLPTDTVPTPQSILGTDVPAPQEVPAVQEAPAETPPAQQDAPGA